MIRCTLIPFCSLRAFTPDIALTCYVDSQPIVGKLSIDSSGFYTQAFWGNDITPFGISTALLTPFHEDGRLNLPLFCTHAQHMLGNGSHGVTLFGTTGEGASISFEERHAALRAMSDAGVDGSAITLGLCATAVADAAAQVQQGLAFGVTKFLLLPPFYFKNLEDEGLFQWHAELFNRVDTSARLIVYHIPQITQVPLSLDLILRLKAAFPERVLAVKDSAGQWDNTRALLESGKLSVLVGDERLLHKALPMGAAGSICGMSNLFPERLRALFDTHAEDAPLSSDVDLIVSVPVVPALKLAMVSMTGNADWGHIRAPLLPITASARAEIEARFALKEDVS